MKTVKEILVAAKAKIEKPENWTQGVSARDINGTEVSVGDTAATCFCSVGAIRSFCDFNDKLYYSTKQILRKFTGLYICKFNDTHTHQEVLEAFDRAIAAAE